MSQSGNLSVTLPPGSTLSFSTDSGSATPAANVIKFKTTGVGANGYTLTGAGDTVTLTIDNQTISGTGQTIGAVTDDIVTFAAGATPGTYKFDINVALFEGTTPAGAGYNIQSTVRTDGAATTLIETPYEDVDEEAALAAADIDVVVSANNVIIRATGVALLTINYKVVASYVFVS